MKFDYLVKVGECRRENGDWDGDITREITYEPSYNSLALAVADIIILEEAFDIDRVKFANMLKRLDLVDILAEQHEDELRDIFEDEAIEEYRNG